MMDNAHFAALLPGLLLALAGLAYANLVLLGKIRRQAGADPNPAAGPARPWLARCAAKAPGLLYVYRLGPDGRRSLQYAGGDVDALFGPGTQARLDSAKVLESWIHPADLPLLHKAMRGGALRSAPYRLELRASHAEKGQIWLEAQARAERDTDGGTLHYGLMLDITARKRAEALPPPPPNLPAPAEQRLQDFIAHFPGFAYTFHLSPQGRGSFPFASPGIETLYGLKPEAVQDDMAPVHALAHPDDQPRILATLGESQRTMAPAHAEFRIRRPGLPERWVEFRSVPVQADDGGTLWHGLMFDIDQRKRIESALSFIAQQGWTEGGQCFFDALAGYLGERLAVDYVVIDRLDDEPGMAQTVALYARGDIVPNLRYALAGTPCANVAQGRLCVYRQNVQAQFPEDSLLVDMGVESYAGLPLWDSAGQAIGLIAVMDGKPIADEAAVTQLLQLVAVRAAAELERARSEHRLRQREWEFRSLAENALDFIARYDRECRILYFNPGLETFLNVSTMQVWGKTPTEAFPDGRYTAYEADLRRVIAGGEPADYYFSTPDGGTGELHYHIRMAPERSEDGVVAGVLAIGRDITDRKRLEDALRHSQAMLEEAQRIAQLGSWELDLESNALSWSDEIYRIFEIDPQRFGASYEAFLAAIHPDDRDRVDRAYRQSVRKRQPYTVEHRLLFADGRVKYVQERGETRYAEDGRPLLSIGTVQDITAAKHDRRQLDLLNFALNQVQDAAYLIDAQGQFRYVNNAACHALGYSRKELLQMGVPDIDPDFPAERWQEQWPYLLTQGSMSLESRHKASDGRIFPAEINASSFKYDGERYCLALVRDISDRQQMEERLRRSEREYRTLAENSPDIIVRYDRDCRRLYVNPAYARTTGSSAKQVLGLTPEEIWRTDAKREEYLATLRRVIDSGQSATVTLDFLAPDGRRASHAVYMVAEHDADGLVAGALAIGRDISALKEVELRLRESRAQLRQLAASRETAREEERRRIAREIHDELGQILTALRMDASRLRLRFGTDNAPLLEHAQGMTELVDRALTVVRGISSDLRPAVLDLGLAAALEWLAGEFSQRSGITCRCRFEDGGFSIEEPYATAIFRVVQEALTNVARHAEAASVLVLLQWREDGWRLEVGDDGRGFDAERLPSNTLGLLGMKERILLLGGELDIASAPGEGTRLRASLPHQANNENPEPTGSRTINEENHGDH
jgi:PAS domain S-box-containing protein